ncbi:MULTISPECIES: DUF397 domain-containing protein [Streptomyces]|uniref:DUF397 domain-containing protein n=1 Tax=Streptomyces TaxID=1883 RepID=UPI00099F6AA5|nr:MULTISPECIES: DUF397 domain-containing protein [unclassified Streptomyces]MCP3765481.1 DUF397 domain-containing protein [Streptomyces sp. MAR25Y5]
MSTESRRRLVWHKSSYSGNEGGECVEIAVVPGTVHVRDSKDVDRPHLSVRTAGWAAFVDFAAG